MTQYVVLEWKPDASLTILRPLVSARTDKHAIKLALEDADKKSGTFVAVPARSWRKLTVSVETKTALKFS